MLETWDRDVPGLDEDQLRARSAANEGDGQRLADYRCWR
jgi:hypothetical protein